MLQPWGHCHGDPHGPGEQLAVPGLGGGTCASLGPPNAAPQCKEPLCSLIPGPGSSSARPGGRWQQPLGWGAPSHGCGAHPTVRSRASTTHAYVCVRVLWVAGEGPCCSELLAPSRTIPSCQGRPRHSSRSCSSSRCLSAVPAPVPAPLPSCPRADAGALSTEPRHCVSTSPAMAWLGNARQDALDAGEAGGMGRLVLQAHCWAGWGPHPRQDHEGYSGQGGAQQGWPEVGGVWGSAAVVFLRPAGCQGPP